MKTIIAKTPKRPADRKTSAAGVKAPKSHGAIVSCATKNLLKNVIKNPE